MGTYLICFKLTLTKEVSLGVKRLKNFILGLLIVVIGVPVIHVYPRWTYN